MRRFNTLVFALKILPRDGRGDSVDTVKPRRVVPQHVRVLDIGVSLLATSGGPQQRVNVQLNLSCTYNQPRKVDHRMKLGDLRGSFGGSFDGHLRLRSLGGQIV